LETGTYSLTIEKEGYYPREIKSISTEKDVNLGDIKLYTRGGRLCGLKAITLAKTFDLHL